MTKAPNRLINETSPYLLQHANNPVDWWAWCEEAFDKARAGDKPVFLSIGYSACHWCHVMEREVFEREEAAEILNRYFISIKVDREERPDVDHLYMESCMALTGSGGWPLTIFMTPEKQPFFAGTYFPLSSFLSIAGKVSSLWVDDRRHLYASAKSVLAAISQEPRTAAAADREQLSHYAVRQLKSSFDSRFGGFGNAPKFPSAHTLMFLQRYALRYKDEKAGEMARFTLQRMALGGLRDHVGGGFYRYSTDRIYLIPHFEKMLYDNAMLATAYAEQGFAAAAHEILLFCERELKAPEGAYYTALDADSEGVEGKYYVFSPSEIVEAVGETDAKRYCGLYDITQQGNFEGKNLPNLINTGELTQADEAFASACHEKLLTMRSTRVPPLRDEKILLSSNALMLAALSTCGRLLKTPDYLHRAVTLAEFLLHSMRREGRLYASYRGQLSQHLATSDDYAYLAWGLYRLHQATLDDRWLQASMEICDEMLRLFESEDGLLWLSGSDVRDLPLRVKNTQDSALPCGNGIAAGVLLRLNTVSGNSKYLEAYRKLSESLSAQAGKYPTAYTAFLSALLLEGRELHVEIPLQKQEMKQVFEEFHPFASFVPGSSDTAAVCTGDACLPPVNDAAALREALD